MKKALRQLVSTDRRFQSSVNLMLDIDSDDKVESYIPTRSSLSILASYLNDIKSSNKSLIYNTKFHLHPLTLCVTDRPWLCDNCRKSFSKKEKSYFCSLCDFDLCKNCLL